MDSGGRTGLPQASEDASRRSGLNSGKRSVCSGRSRFPRRCPECNSEKIWRDGLRHLNGGGVVQRFICRSCGYRFSESEMSRQPLNTSSSLDYNRLVCVSEGEMKNLAEVESRSEKRAAGATVKHNEADLKGKLVEYLWYLKRQGYAVTTSRTYYYILKLLVKRGVDINNPESVKKFIAIEEAWSKGRKWNVVKAYSLFLKMQSKTWEKPRYKAVEKLPFIPTENEIDGLIAGCSRQIATFLQILKETGARRGEAFDLKWTDIDLVTNTIRITPEKGSKPRIFKISEKLAKMLGRLPRKAEKVWAYSTLHNIDRGYRRQRKRIAYKLGNPRLKRITFHTFRHWKATTEYAKTKDILYVQQLLGHRQLKTTLKYTQLVQLPHEEKYICKVAKTVEEAKELIEAGFDYVTDIDDCKLFRKMKVTYLGSRSNN